MALAILTFKRALGAFWNCQRVCVRRERERGNSFIKTQKTHQLRTYSKNSCSDSTIFSSCYWKLYRHRAEDDEKNGEQVFDILGTCDKFKTNFSHTRYIVSWFQASLKRFFKFHVAFVFSVLSTSLMLNAGLRKNSPDAEESLYLTCMEIGINITRRYAKSASWKEWREWNIFQIDIFFLWLASICMTFKWRMYACRMSNMWLWLWQPYNDSLR